MIDDAHIRRLVLQAIPDIDPYRFEVCMMDWDAAVGWWLRKDDGSKDHGRAIAIRRTEGEIATEIATDISRIRCGTVIEGVEILPEILPDISPYEGKGGRHPNNCTCSKHKA